MNLSAALRSLPNALTCLRIGLALAFPLCVSEARLAVLLVALATDVLDGALARRFGWTSAAGQVLDPIADKLLFAAVTGTFLLEHRLSVLELLALGIRDLGVAVGSLALILGGGARRIQAVAPTLLGKGTTIMQGVVYLLLALGFRLNGGVVGNVFAMGALATVQYVYRATRALEELAPASPARARAPARPRRRIA